jgi:hypothetical protein
MTKARAVFGRFDIKRNAREGDVTDDRDPTGGDREAID